MGEAWLSEVKSAVKLYPHEFVGVIPFSREITSESPITGYDYIPYGSTLLTTLAHEKEWRGCHFDLNKFNYAEYIKNRDDILNTAGVICSVEYAVRLLKSRPNDELWFVRPSADLKQFSGQVIEAKECADWLEDAMLCESSGSYKLDQNTEIVLAQPQTIQAEWRWFIVGRKVISGSMYRYKGKLVAIPETDINVIQRAQTFADKWLPNPCCVMDLALVDNELKVLEFNCINASGFYKHDVKAIFKSLYEYHTIFNDPLCRY